MTNLNNIATLTIRLEDNYGISRRGRYISIS